MNVIFKIGADTNVGMVRKNNEDNFTVSSDLSKGWQWVSDQESSLGNLGALLVVADGMGGMNAGEVASEIAIQTVHSYFTYEHIASHVRLDDPNSIVAFMNNVIVKADENIKMQARNNPENKGMGTTIVIGWLLGNKLYVSWCGDSRAYVFNPAFGLHQLTVDHSYVQSLVEKGAISREAAFDFPESNIITRSLCDAIPEPAQPESLAVPYTVADGDIILLCTDGLCGMIRDKQIQTVIENSPDDMGVIVQNLIAAACKAAGSDNVTVVACEIVSGGDQPQPLYFAPIEQRLNGTAMAAPMPAGTPPAPQASPKPAAAVSKPVDNKMLLWILAAVAAVLVVGLAVFFAFKGSNSGKDVETEEQEQLENTDQEKPGEEAVPYDMSGSVGSIANPAANVIQQSQNANQTQSAQSAEEGKEEELISSQEEIDGVPVDVEAILNSLADTTSNNNPQKPPKNDKLNNMINNLNSGNGNGGGNPQKPEENPDKK